MCKAIRDMKEKERAEGRAEGREEGRAEGRKEGHAQGREEGLEKGREKGLEQGKAMELTNNIETLKKSMEISLEQAVHMLGKTMQEYEKAQELLMKKV